MTTDDVIKELMVPGRNLLFIDDSGTSKKPLKELVKDFVVLCGVVVESERYKEIVETIREHLSKATENLDELHTTEILNPGKRSPWRKVGDEYRIASLELLRSLVSKHALRLPYMYIGVKQYCELLMKGVARRKSHKTGLKEAYYYAAVNSEWCTDGNPFAIIYDSEKDLEGRLKIYNIGNRKMLCGGFIEASSEQIPGIQLADFAAYSLNRVFHIRDRVMEKGKCISKFDQVILNAYEENESKYDDMLSWHNDA